MSLKEATEIHEHSLEVQAAVKLATAAANKGRGLTAVITTIATALITFALTMFGLGKDVRGFEDKVTFVEAETTANKNDIKLNKENFEVQLGIVKFNVTNLNGRLEWIEDRTGYIKPDYGNKLKE